MTIIRSIMNHIFIVYIFDVIDVNSFLDKIGQT